MSRKGRRLTDGPQRPQMPGGSIFINTDQVPATVAAAVLQLYAGCDPQLEKELRQPVVTKTVRMNGIEKKVKTGGSAGLHLGIGMQIRNAWGLWEDTPLRRDAIETYGLAHADDISGLLFEMLRARCMGETYDEADFIERITLHWRNYGQTPLSAGGLQEDGKTPLPK
jgi:hypothetical protein